MSRLLDALFAGVDDDEGLGGHHHLVSRRLAPRLVYRGYVDDPRNTVLPLPLPLPLLLPLPPPLPLP